MKTAVKENQVMPVDGDESSPSKGNRLPPMTVDAFQKTQGIEGVSKPAVADQAHDTIKEKFHSGVKKAAALAEMQRRHSIEEWQALPHGVRFMTHPEHPTKTKWDLILAAMILYSVTTVPWRIAFNVDAQNIWLALDILVDIFFAFDIIVSFRTGYVDEDGKMEWRSGKIARHYLTGWFAIDFISTVPVDHLVAAATSNGPSGLRLVKLVRLVRLVRLAKLMKLINFDDFLEGHAFLDHNRGLVSIFAMLLQITFIAHLMGCIWYSAAVKSSGDSASEVLFHEDSWIVVRYGAQKEAQALDVWKRYIASIYWAITTMATVGYGDINTQNDEERGFAVLAMCVGASAFGYTIGIISDLMQNSNIEKVKKREKMNRLLHYCISVDLPYWIKKRLKKQWEFDCRKRGVFDEAEMLQFMPLQVKDSCVKKGKYLQLTKQIPVLFATGQLHDIHYTVAVMQRLRYAAMKFGDVLFEESSVGWHTYFVCQGKMKIDIDVGQQPVPESDTAESAFPDRKMVCVKVKDSNGTWSDMVIGSNEVLAQNFTIPGDGSVSRYRATANGFLNELCSLSRDAVAELSELWPDLVDNLKKGQEALITKIDTFKAAHLSGKEMESEEVQEDVANSSDDGSINENLAAQNDLEKGIFHNPSPQELWQLKIIFPESNWKVNWDLFVGTCILISVIVEPLRLCFDLESKGAGAVIDVIIDTTFWVDMFMSFRTAYFTEQRQLIYDGNQVVRHYLTGWFAIDFITTFPVDRMAGEFVDDPKDLRVVKILRVLRLFRLAKLAKIMQNGPLFEKFEDLTQGINQSFFNLCFLILVLLMAAHLIGCTWHFVAASEDSWVRDYFYDSAPAETGEAKKNFSTLYLTSFYWALATMTTVGYGDISANMNSNIEMVIAMGSMLIGTTTFAYIIGELVMAVLNYDPADKELKIKKRSMKKFLEERNLPGYLVGPARKGLKFSAEFSSIFECQALLAEMPEFLLRILVDFKYESTIERFTLFKNLEKKFVGCCSLILPMLQPLVAERGVWLFEVGGKISAAYFIQKGLCRLHSPNKSLVRSDETEKTHASEKTTAASTNSVVASDEDRDPNCFKAGDVCGETTLFIPVGARFRLCVGVKVVDTSHALVLARKSFFKIQEICPTLFTNLRLRWKNKQTAEQWIGDCDWGQLTK